MDIFGKWRSRWYIRGENKQTWYILWNFRYIVVVSRRCRSALPRLRWKQVIVFVSRCNSTNIEITCDFNVAKASELLCEFVTVFRVADDERWLQWRQWRKSDVQSAPYDDANSVGLYSQVETCTKVFEWKCNWYKKRVTSLNTLTPSTTRA